MATTDTDSSKRTGTNDGKSTVGETANRPQGTDVGSKNTGGTAGSPPRGRGFADEDDDEPTPEQRDAAAAIARERHESPNEGAIESLGRAIGEGLTGADQNATPGAAPTKPANR
jgi:hypothetical protein